MSAGLPGLGLGGLFFILSALLAPFPELWRTLRGRSDLAAWRAIGRQFAQAAAMVAAIDLTLRLAYAVLSAAGLANAPSGNMGTVLPLTLLGITSALLVAVLGAAKLAELGARARAAGFPRVPEARPRAAPLRALSLGGAAALAWLALLAVGASELSPLSQPETDRSIEQQAGPTGSPSTPTSRPTPRISEAPAAATAEVKPSADGSQPPADGGRGGGGNDAAGPGLQPPVPVAPSPVTPVTPVGQPQVDLPPSHDSPPSPGAKGPGGSPSAGGTTPAEKGPPPGSGPPESSQAPDHAGPPPDAGPDLDGGSPASETHPRGGGR